MAVNAILKNKDADWTVHTKLISVIFVHICRIRFSHDGTHLKLLNS